jgi:hypothetical protein
MVRALSHFSWATDLVILYLLADSEDGARPSAGLELARRIKLAGNILHPQKVDSTSKSTMNLMAIFLREARDSAVINKCDYISGDPALVVHRSVVPRHDCRKPWNIVRHAWEVQTNSIVPHRIQLRLWDSLQKCLPNVKVSDGIVRA